MSIVITGTPGVGKHTISQMIAKDAGLEVIDVNQIVAESGLLRDSQGTGDVDTSELAEILKKHTTTSSLIVGHLAPYAISPEQVKIVVVLRRNPYELIQTYKKRGYSISKCMENAGSEVLGIIYHDAKNRFGEKTFQVESSEIHDTVKKVNDAICGRREDDIDWLDVVTRNGDLKKFFAY
ncbi:MAG: AAA family ATPase [Thaumarchaeota archaeon]|nr:AAA family ATPase [Nitrososphaerota archaeon]